ncbi:diguanylate phosphodiesterase [Vibrio albus]|uniref:Diguanylate phosphodiesterase n=1 Tax=Vibrio albus TaxID=2200953 RepID=A0A2U3B891_9VIBR|nr:EAL domain-containing protein [Vibrio albus]PWI33019.1 diguanylate phosphodiesterase [Vibrio albus]
MDNVLRSQALYDSILRRLPKEPETPDDAILLEAFTHNDVRHACQPIRHIRTDQVTYQHLTLRFGSNGEQSVYHFDTSEAVKRCLDLYSLSLAIHQISFQLETFHPDVINDLVVPIRADIFSCPDTQKFIRQLISQHKKALRHIIPTVQLFNPDLDLSLLASQLQPLREHTAELWFDVKSPTPYLEQLELLEPKTIKVSQPLHDFNAQVGLIPIIKYIRSHHLCLVSGQVNTQKELNQLKKLGTTYYFGYISDIPISYSTHGPNSHLNEKESKNEFLKK